MYPMWKCGVAYVRCILAYSGKYMLAWVYRGCVIRRHRIPFQIRCRFAFFANWWPSAFARLGKCLCSLVRLFATLCIVHTPNSSHPSLSHSLQNSQHTPHILCISVRCVQSYVTVSVCVFVCMCAATYLRICLLFQFVRFVHIRLNSA